MQTAGTVGLVADSASGSVLRDIDVSAGAAQLWAGGELSVQSETATVGLAGDLTVASAVVSLDASGEIDRESQ